MQSTSFFNNFSPPTFIGLVNFCHQFIPNCTQILHPLNAILSVTSERCTTLSWDEATVTAFTNKCDDRCLGYSSWFCFTAVCGWSLTSSLFPRRTYILCDNRPYALGAHTDLEVLQDRVAIWTISRNLYLTYDTFEVQKTLLLMLCPVWNHQQILASPDSSSLDQLVEFRPIH